MSMTISPTRSAAPAAASPAVSKDKAGSTAKPAAAGSTVVTISSAARAAAQEAAETPAQTAQEARGSDMQAKRLLARQEAMHKSYS